MNLRTLGGLALEGSTFARPMRLLLLAYLAIEGPTARERVDTLFAADEEGPGNGVRDESPAERARNNLTTALGQIRREAGRDLIVRSQGTVEVAVRCDAVEFETAIAAGDLERAAELYQGPFLHEAERLRYMRPDRWDPDLEVWVRTTRLRLAGRALGAFVRLGQASARMDDVEKAVVLGERALEVFAATVDEDAYEAERSCFAFTDLQVLDGLLALTPGDGGARFRDLTSEYADLVLPDDPRSSIEAHLRVAPGLAGPQVGVVIGRKGDAQALSRLLDRGSGGLITIVGPGGIGKTTLAMHLARQRAAEGRYPDGVHVVSLEDVRFANLVPVRIAAAVGATLQVPGDALEQLIAHLRPRRALLVLDNYEHLLERRDVPASLVEQCPHVAVLITSRERLNVPGETAYRLAGLPIEDDEDVDIDAPDGGAVQWYVRAARSRTPKRTFDPDELAAIARLCRFLEGHPLAIELAARLGDLIPLDELEARLRSDAALLDDAIEELPERGRSLRTIWESAWASLDEEDHRILSALAVFEGGFTWEAAREVAGADLGRLRRWVERSLVQAGEAQRMHVHPTLRAFLMTKLRELGNESSIVERHAALFLRLAGHHASRLRDPGAREALSFFAIEQANVRAAWASAEDPETLAAFARVLAVPQIRTGDLDSRMALLEKARASAERAGRSEDVVELTNAVADVRLQRGEADEAYDVLRLALARSSELYERDDLRAETLSQLGGVHYLRREHDEAIEHFEKARALHEARGDRAQAAAELGNIGAVWFQRGDFAEAVRIWKRALTGHRRAGDLELQALALNNLGAAHQALGAFDAALVCLEKAEVLLDTLGDAAGVVSTRVNIGAIAFVQGAYARSRALNEQALDAHERSGDVLGAALVRTNLAMLDEREGDLEAAHATLTEVLELQERYDERVHRVATLYNLATVSLRLGQRTRAATFARDALELAHEAEHPVGAAYAHTFLADALTANGALGEAEAGYDAAEGGFRTASDIVGVVLVAVRRAALAAARDRLDDALTLAREARKRALNYDALPLALEAAEIELRVAHAVDDRGAIAHAEAHVRALTDQLSARRR